MEVCALYLKRKLGAPLACVNELHGIAGVGLEGDCQASPSSPRHVLLFDRATLEELALDDRAVRANVIVDGRLDALGSGTILGLGSLALRVTIPCEACRKLERERVGLARILEGRRGMLARVIRSGTVRIGDVARVASSRVRKLDEDWHSRVADIVRHIPEGRHLTYAELARIAGVHPSFTRSFGRLLAKLDTKQVVPSKAAGLSFWNGDSYWACEEHLALIDR